MHKIVSILCGVAILATTPLAYARSASDVCEVLLDRFFTSHIQTNFPQVRDHLADSFRDNFRELMELVPAERRDHILELMSEARLGQPPGDNSAAVYMDFIGATIIHRDRAGQLVVLTALAHELDHLVFHRNVPAFRKGVLGDLLNWLHPIPETGRLEHRGWQRQRHLAKALFAYPNQRELGMYLAEQLRLPRERWEGFADLLTTVRVENGKIAYDRELLGMNRKEIEALYEGAFDRFFAVIHERGLLSLSELQYFRSTVLHKGYLASLGMEAASKAMIYAAIGSGVLLLFSPDNESTDDEEEKK